MSINLLLNSSNYNAQTGALVYQFPSGVQMADMECSLNSCSFYNSFFNISAAIGNNTIVYKHPIFTASNTYTMTNYTLTLADGYYTIADINNAFQNLCLQNGLYCYNASTGQNVYFARFSQNAVRYSFQIDTYLVPTSTQCTSLGFTTGGMVLNVGNIAVSPQIVTSTALATFLGIPGGTYPVTVSTSSAGAWASDSVSTTLSKVSPQVNRVTGLIFRCDLISSPYSIPSDLLCQVPISSSFGAATQYVASQPLWSHISNQKYSQVSITFQDQNGGKLYLYDTEMSAVLAIRPKPK